MNESNSLKTITEAVRIHSQSAIGCILCDIPTQNRGAFFPANSQEFGAADGKSRAIVYPLCDQHPQTQETFERVERVIKMDMEREIRLLTSPPG